MIKLYSNIIVNTLDDEIVLTDRNTDKLRIFNKTGNFILKRILDGIDCTSIVEEIFRITSLNKKDIEIDVNDFVNQLIVAKILYKTETDGSSYDERC